MTKPPFERTPIDIAIKEWATARQCQFVDAVNEAGSLRGAARALGVAYATLRVSVAAAQRRAATMGYAPDHDMKRPAAPGFAVKGTSTLIDEGGNVKLQWVKTQRDEQQVEAVLREFITHLVEDARALAPLTPAPAAGDEDLLAVYPMGDPHFGMRAWAAECGEDFDLSIAESVTCAAVDRLVASAPAAHTALLLNLGDMFHADTQDNTTRSGHQLDVDGRWTKVMQVGLRAMLHCIRRLLEKHRDVVVRINKGNHDGHSSFALALALDAYFASEPRVKIDLSPAAMWYFRFGRVLLGSTHGDTCKMANLPGVMAADKPVEWGKTAHRYWYIGHVHHQDLKEYPGVVCETFRTLAARDAWHAGQGYRAGRDMRLIVHHREHGEVERHRCDVGMLT